MTKTHELELKARKFPAWLPWALIIIGAIGLAVSGTLLFNSSKDTLKPPPDALHSASASAPSAVKPSQEVVDTYTVEPDLPKYITIPSVGIDKTRILRLGLDKNSAMAVPNNSFDTGWYDGSRKPGQQGAMFIYGHVSTWQAPGIFYNLKKLKPNDIVVVTRGDDKVFTYQVVSAKIYPADAVDMNTVLSPVNAGTPGLNLMTCTGAIIKGTSEFTERLVVFTKLAS